MSPVVREHAGQHDAIADLPLITETATVTAVENLDQDRRDEVVTAIDSWLSEYELKDAVGSVAEYDKPGQLHDRVVGAGYPALARKCATLAERFDRPKPMLVRVEFETDEPVEFVAGQYVGLRYDETPRAYSLSSSPTRNALEICVRRIPGGRLSPQLCEDIAVGDELTIRGPYGDLVLQDHSAKDIAFLATGTGVAPFKSMIDYLFETGRDTFEGRDRDIWLFLGAAWKDDLPFREAFRRRLREHENFHFVPCLSRESALSDWPGETDYVQHALLKHTDPAAVTTSLGDRLERWLRREPQSGVSARLDPSSLEVYACGLNAMVYSLVRMVQRLGVPDRHIDSEGFG